LYLSVTRIFQKKLFVTLVIHAIDQIMNGWWITKKCIILYSICYVELQLHRVTKFVVLMYNFYLTVICFQYKITSIKSDTFNSITKLDQLSIFLLFCWHSMTYNTCSWRLIRFETLFNIYFTVICIPIYNHIKHIRHVQQHYELFMLSIFLFFCCCWHSMT
jgi:hypothetical protein